MNQGNGLVLELQRACIEKKRSITDILRMAKMIAIKLGLPGEEHWIDQELNGYKGGKELPPYRMVKGTVKALNPYHGLVPARFQDPDMEELINDVYVGDSVEHLLDLGKDDGEITYRFEPQVEAHLIKQQGQYGAMQPYKVIGKSHVAGVLNSIQNRVLDWALQLESNGITGENMSFTNDEKDKAAQVLINNVQGNVQGTVGQAGGTANQTFNNISVAVEAGNFDSLADHLRNNNVPDADILELEEAVKSDGIPDNPENFGPKVSAWMGNMVGKAASGSWAVTAGAAGNLLAGSIGKFYGL